MQLCCLTSKHSVHSAYPRPEQLTCSKNSPTWRPVCLKSILYLWVTKVKINHFGWGIMENGSWKSADQKYISLKVNIWSIVCVVIKSSYGLLLKAIIIKLIKVAKTAKNSIAIPPGGKKKHYHYNTHNQCCNVLPCANFHENQRKIIFWPKCTNWMMICH